MLTTYDEIYETFLLNCGYDFTETPQDDQGKYRLIHNAIRIYNQKAEKYDKRIQGNVVCEDSIESLNTKLTATEVLIVAYIMAEVLASTKFTEFTSIYGVYAKEMGFKDYSAQVAARQYTIENFRKKYTELIEDEVDTFTMGW